MMPTRFSQLLPTLLLLALASGCGKAHRVEGTVRYHNEPVAGAKVSLVPLFDGGGTVSEVTDSAGAFRTRTGIPAGDYVLVVEKNDWDQTPAKTVHPGETGEVKPRRRTWPKNSLPARYQDPGQSPLRFSVPTGEPVQLELTDR
jgi:hypothetical protein